MKLNKTGDLFKSFATFIYQETEESRKNLPSM